MEDERLQIAPGRILEIISGFEISVFHKGHEVFPMISCSTQASTGARRRLSFPVHGNTR